MTYPLSWPLAPLVQLGIFRNTVTLQTKTESQDSFGAVMEDWATQLADVPCLLSSTLFERAMASGEQRMAHFTEGRRHYLALIPQRLTSITTAWRALIDGEPWDIRGVDCNPLVEETRLFLEQVSI